MENLELHKRIRIPDGITYSTRYLYGLSGALIGETYLSGRVVKNTLDQDGNLSQVQSKKDASNCVKSQAFWIVESHDVLLRVIAFKMTSSFLAQAINATFFCLPRLQSD